MKSGYKRLGNYIRLVDERNRDLEVKTLLGVSIRKMLIPSIANIVGTDMSTYKIIKENQFAYGTVTSRNGDKISIALLKEFDKAIVSQVYLVFEVIDEELLLPDYLMMWFRRPEFDRYARFKSHGSARETFDWAEMLETELRIPSLEKQKELIAEYEVIENRIQINKKLCATLEETAQTIYKHWFEDFEFPDENGNPYKSSGGEMVECEELGKEIPIEFKLKKIKDLGKVITGKTPSSQNPEDYGDIMSFVTPGDFSSYGKFAIGSERYLSQIGIQNLKGKILPVNSIIITCIGSDMGKVVLTNKECITNQQMNSIIPSNYFTADYFYHYFKSYSKELKSIAIGSSTMPMINKSDFENLHLILPTKNLLKMFTEINQPLNFKLIAVTKQTQKLEELKSLLLGKMAVENNF